MEIFEYRKNNDWYWDGAKFNNKMITKPLLIMQALYPRYLYLYL